MKVNIVEINDLHFGIAATEREKEELNLFLDFIKTNPVDIIHFNGDYFDHKLSLGEPAALMGMEFFNDVLTIAKEKNIKIRMLEGTQSHDRFQPRIFDNFILDDAGNKLIDYKFFETVGVEELMGLRILYVPEEYPMNIDEYYGPYKQDKFDIMFVHGTWDFINFGGTIDNNRNDINTAPVFKYSEWKDALEHGVCIAGHIHGRHGFKDKSGMKIIYPGSFTAWSFDQISERGFLYLTFDTETKKFDYQFINNPKSPKYANLDVSDLGLDFNKCTNDEIINKIQEQKDKVDFIKVDINALPLEKRSVIKQYYKDNKNIKTESETAKLILNENKIIDNKHAYILEDKMSVEDIVVRFVKEEFDKTITTERVKEIITDK